MLTTRHLVPSLITAAETDYNRLAARGWPLTEVSRYRARLAVWEGEGGAVVKQRNPAVPLEMRGDASVTGTAD